jgi:hypothetical protein
VCGVIIRPTGATWPGTWNDFDSWFDDGHIDNTDSTFAHFVAGLGSFLPLSQTEATLAGGRLVENREFVYRLTLNVPYIDDGHVSFARQLQRNKKDFTVYIVTIGGVVAGVEKHRIVGGDEGIQPFYVNASIPFNQGKTARESIQMIFDVEFLEIPEMSL